MGEILRKEKEHWSSEGLEYLSIGALEHWSIGAVLSTLSLMISAPILTLTLTHSKKSTHIQRETKHKFKVNPCVENLIFVGSPPKYQSSLPLQGQAFTYR